MKQIVLLLLALATNERTRISQMMIDVLRQIISTISHLFSPLALSNG